jgi:hypothetical protein
MIENFSEFWEEVKEPGFITEDGKEIEEGDWFYAVYENYTIGKYKYDPNDMHENCKYFSTMKAAVEYAELNLPCLSFNDVWGIVDILSDLALTATINKNTLRELVSKKITEK